jgi:hypothetical protein
LIVTEKLDVYHLTQSMEKLSENLNLTEKRMKLFQQLDYAITVSHEKSDKTTAGNSDRQKWLRLLITAVDSYGGLLKDLQLDSVEQRLAETERLLGVKKQ